MADASKSVEQAYEVARQQFADWGIDTGLALSRLAKICLSLHCWQGDDVRGFEGGNEELGGGLAVTGRYPGRARSADELRADLETALALIPGRHRVNLHAIYAETGGRPVPRNELTVAHFQRWIEWARSLGVGLDFNSTDRKSTRLNSSHT